MVARRELDGRLANLRQRLADVTATRFHAQGEPCCTERTFTSFIRAEEEIASLRVRMGRLRRDHYHGRRRRLRSGATREAGAAGPARPDPGGGGGAAAPARGPPPPAPPPAPHPPPPPAARPAAGP